MINKYILILLEAKWLYFKIRLKQPIHRLPGEIEGRIEK